MLQLQGLLQLPGSSAAARWAQHAARRMLHAHVLLATLAYQNYLYSSVFGSYEPVEILGRCVPRKYP